MNLAHFRSPWTRALNLLAMFLWIIQPALVLDGGQSTNNGYTLTVSASQDTVDPGGSTNIIVQLTGPDGAPIEGASLSFTAVAGDGSLQFTNTMTDYGGNSVVGYNTGTSTAQINVFDNQGYGVSASCVVNVNQPPPPPSCQLWIGADKNPVQNGETTNVRVCLTDANSGAGVGEAAIYFNVASGDAMLGALSASTDSNGYASIPVTARSAPSQINAAFNWSNYTTSNGFVLLCPQSGDTINIGARADQNPLPPNAITLLSTSVSDATVGLPMGCEVSFDVQSGDGWLYDASGNATKRVVTETDSDGNSAFSFQGGVQPSTILVSAWNGSTFSVTQTLTIGVPSHVYQLNLSSGQSMLQTGQQATVTAQLWDTTDNVPVPNAPLTFQIAGGGDGLFFGGTMNATSSVSVATDSNGSAALPFMGGYLNSTLTVADLTYGMNQSTIIGVLSINDTGNLTLNADDNVVLASAQGRAVV